MCANRRFASSLLVLVKHFVKTIINRFYSFALNLTSPFARNIKIELKELGFHLKTEFFPLFEAKSG